MDTPKFKLHTDVIRQPRLEHNLVPNVVYTANVGNVDRIVKPIKTNDKFVVMTEKKFSDNRLSARWYKVMSHKLFPDARYTLWVDGNIQLINKITVERLAAEYLANSDIAVFRHDKRKCVYQEAIAVINQKLDDRDKVYKQMFRYTQENYPINNGLSELPVVLRRNTYKVAEFNELWWQELSNGSKRDQLSFDYLAWKTGIGVTYFPGVIHVNKIFKKHLHRGE